MTYYVIYENIFITLRLNYKTKKRAHLLLEEKGGWMNEMRALTYQRISDP
jgi:hypothetical protein